MRNASRTDARKSLRIIAIGEALSFTVVALFILLGAQSSLAEDQGVNYSRDIRPLLSNHCYACHGPDEKKREADLRLDLRDSAIELAIEPGSAEDSELVARIITEDPELRMPPPQSKRPALTADEIDLLRRWIDEGATFDEHWAYVTPKRMPVPQVKNRQWPVNPIDHFIAAEHERRGFTSSGEADRRTLIRRLSFDLVGLPPTPEQVDAFVADDSPEAYERLVDELLASEHFGERMAMYWLDVVRYADTNGIHGDNHRDHDLYRDYVIKAFNENKPFDQFSIEQLAGDLIPNATNEQKVASGYNRLNMTTREGGAQPKEYLAKYSADRVRNTSLAWMGSTLGCAECHDHKYDPFKTQDFYSFAAFFADIQETAVGEQQPVKIPTFDQEQQLKELDEQIAQLKAARDAEAVKLVNEQATWEQQARAELETNGPAWQAVKPESLESSGNQTLTVQEDLSVLASGTNPAKDDYAVTLKTDMQRITGARLEALMHPTLSNGSLSRGNGNFVLSRFEVEVQPVGAAEKQAVKLTSAVADHSQDGFPVANAIDGKSDTGWAVEGHVKKENRTAVFTFAEPISGGAGTTIVIHLRHESPYASHNIGCFRLSLTNTDKPSLEEEAGFPVQVAAALRTEGAKRTSEQQQALVTYYHTIAPELKPLNEQLNKLQAQRDAVAQSFRPILVSMSGNPRTMRILPRGNWLDDSGSEVQPAVPGFLKPLNVQERRPTRMDLAEWLVDSDNPLTARVFVNRLWKIAFGRGLCRSLDDFGAQGTMPSHPELLDWLAVEFIESGWNVKHMLKLMVMSRTYRQSSFESKELRQLDPQNKWLSRQNRFRLDAEMVRDNALAISGLLVTKIGGPSVKPYQPEGYWDHLNFPTRKWQHDRGESQYRRGLYTYWCRTFLHPSLLAFDAPSREESCVERPRSNTPLQALVLLNDPTYVEAARVFAARIISEGGASDSERVDFAFSQALGRKPRQAEVDILTGLYEQHFKQYQEDAAAAAEVLKNGLFAPPKEIDTAELAAWTTVARVILNLHETIARY